MDAFALWGNVHHMWLQSSTFKLKELVKRAMLQFLLERLEDGRCNNSFGHFSCFC